MASIIGVETLQHTNGTEAATISSGGVFTPSVPVGFSATLTATTTSVPHATYTKLPVNANNATALSEGHQFDTHSGFDNTNNYYTIPTGLGGYWLLNAGIEFDIVSTVNLLLITTTTTASDSGNWLGRAGNASANLSANNQGIHFNGVWKLDAGTIIKLECYHNYGSAKNVMGHDSYKRTWLEGWRLA